VQVLYTNSKAKTTSFGNLPILQDLADVFPENISQLSPKIDIDFTIELIPGTSFVSRAPYHMSVPEPNELKMQLKSY